MRQFLEILTFVIIGVALFWLGITLFAKLGLRPRWWSLKKQDSKKPEDDDSSGDPNKTCPVCSKRLSKGELVSSEAFPSTTSGKDRLMHIRGCVYCLNGDRRRVCPVCGTVLEANEILVARLFERLGRRSHIHVIGCSQCRKSPGSSRQA